MEADDYKTKNLEIFDEVAANVELITRFLITLIILVLFQFLAYGGLLFYLFVYSGPPR